MFQYPGFSDTKNIPSNIYLVEDIEIHKLIKMSDLVITISSSVSHLSLTQEKPCILVGKNSLWGKGCCYELSEKKDLPSLMKVSLSRGVTQEQKNNFKKYVAREMEYKLYALNVNYDDYFRQTWTEYANQIIKQFS
jgi:hypothetical protein